MVYISLAFLSASNYTKTNVGGVAWVPLFALLAFKGDAVLLYVEAQLGCARYDMELLHVLSKSCHFSGLVLV